jgi:hypothetical protein
MATQAVASTIAPLHVRLPHRRGDILAACIITLVAVASRSVWFGDPAPDFDEQLYSIIGQRMLHGELPYVDLWDRKPFGLFALFAVSHALGGPEAIAYQMLATCFAVAGGWLVYVLAKRLADPATACGAGALYTLLAYAYGSFSGQSEVFFIPLMLGMAMLVWDLPKGRELPRAVFAMLLGGLALQIKYTVLPQCLFLGCVALWQLRGRGPRNLAAIALLFAGIGLSPTVAVGFFYGVAGQLEAWLFANLVSIFDRVPAGRFNLHHLRLIAPLFLLIASGLYAAVRLNPPADRRLYAFCAAWTFFALLGVLIPGTVYVYYYAALAPGAALLAVPLIDRRAELRWLPMALVVLCTAVMVDFPARLGQAQSNRAELYRLASAVAPNVGEDRNCLFVFDGPTALYRLTGSCLPTRFVYSDHLSNALETPALGTDQVAEVVRVLANRPGVIVTSEKPVSHHNPQVQRLLRRALERDYRILTTAELRDRRAVAWARRDQPPVVGVVRGARVIPEMRLVAEEGSTRFR